MEMMNLQLRGIIVLFLLLLVTPDYGLAQTLKLFRNKNGIRLQGGTGSKGRLEVSSRDAWFAEYNGKAAYSPVCDNDNFTDELAETMCQMLSYSYGRRFYGPSITYRKNETGALYVGSIDCIPNIASPPPPPGRRPPPPMSSNSPPPTASPPPSSPEPIASPPPSSPPLSTPTPASPTPVPGYGPGPGETDSTPAAHHHRRHRQHRRRLLRDDASSSSVLAAASGTITSEQQEDATQQQRNPHHRQQQHHRRLQRHSSRARSLYSPVRGTINTPRSSPFSCTIKPGGCDVKGPFVGIECSHTPMAEAPPPPPSPPAPPAAPPAVSGTIRMYGPPVSPNSIVYGDVEPNLVDDMLGNFYGRLDLQVELNGSQVWAPLCAPTDPESNMAYYLAYVACGQVYDWPKPYDGGIGFVQSQVSDRPFPLPEGPFGSGDFDPSAYSAYVTVTGSNDVWDAKSVQELELEVSSAPCPSGGMLAVACMAFGERRRN